MGNRDTRGRATAAAPSTLIAVLTLIVTSDSGGPLSEPEASEHWPGPFPRSERVDYLDGPVVVAAGLIRYEHWGREQDGGWGQCQNPSAMCLVPSEKFGLAPGSRHERLSQVRTVIHRT